MSDGETNEGTTWEAAHFAVSNNLNNLILIIDKNNLQGFGNNIDILGDTSSKEKWNNIGFNVLEVDGHCIRTISEALISKNINNHKPKLIIANTIKGKGVSFMENKLEWHYLPMNELQYENALNDLKNIYK
jgi:transketolase